MESHYHVFDLDALPVHAPTDEGLGHTVFYVMACACGAVDVFPRPNFDITTPEYRRLFYARLRAAGQMFEPMIESLRADVARGATHECGEWFDRRGICALCGRTR
jgi:hypothetical protein